MAYKTSFELYHNFPKLAEESGFTFNTHRPHVHIEWNKIRLVDIDSLIRERKFILIEQHVNDILDCVLESEFDVRILDEGVLKIFRLAQLAVEYQQFCRHYLDRSVFVLREEVTTLAQELDSTKKVLKEKEDEIRKLKKKSKSALRAPLSYGNDNIATMILKTLSNKGDIFPTLASTDTMQHNKCNYCDKVFLNQLYLESHISRRHANMTEIPQKDINKNQFDSSHNENEKLNNEITELRSKLLEMEKLIINLGNEARFENNKEIKGNREPVISKEMKDAGVSTNGEGYILERIEEWKKEEQDKYKKEINLLQTQILAMLDSFKEKEKESATKNDANIMNDLHATIKQQGLEILSLKQELTNAKSSLTADDFKQRKEIETQMSFWMKHAEQQSKEYKLLLQKLDVVAKEAERSREQAEMERARVLQLQNLLQDKKGSLTNSVVSNHDAGEKAPLDSITSKPNIIKNNHKPNLISDRISMQKLHKKAQELLEENTSTSDNSTSSQTKPAKTERGKSVNDKEKYNIIDKISLMKEDNNKKRKTNNVFSTTESRDNIGAKFEKNKNKVRLKENLHARKKNEIIQPRSPMKIVRAKITEEVNNRLVELGVDPLKTRLAVNAFSTQKMLLQEKQLIKFKKYPGSEQIFHSLRMHLDSNATKTKTGTPQNGTLHNSPFRNSKSFSLASVISNVKSKALSIVKTNDHNRNDYKSYDSVAKKAMMLLKTPSSSTNSHLKLQDHNKPDKYKESQHPNEIENKKKTKIRSLSNNTQESVKKKSSDTDSTLSDNIDSDYYVKHHNPALVTIENITKSSTDHPSDLVPSKQTINTEKNNVNLTISPKTLLGVKRNNEAEPTKTKEYSSDDVESVADNASRRAYSLENITKQTKGVLKNASSTSSLSKKKVIFDMDAIQMKSVSVSSPSQSITERSNNKEKYGLGLIHLDSEEWDISSIENDPIPKNPVTTRTSPKIAELRESIESQLTRRNNTKSTAVVGGVDLLSVPLLNKVALSTKSGSNTSLGSSILDDADSTPTENQVAFVKPRSFIERDDSEIDISEFVTEEFVTNNTIKT